MAHPRPFRFGVQCSTPPDYSATAWAELARTVEDLGYSVLTVADHFDNQYAPVPALMAAADATTTLRVGALVLCTDYTHPVVIAKEAATLDLLSDGRFELGLGAGWMTTDYEQAGIPLDPPGTRIQRLEEAVQVIDGLWRDEPCTFHGNHYDVTALEGRPKPVHQPRPPILIGGGGRKVLSLAARHADIVGLNIDLRRGVIDTGAGPNATDAATEQKLDWIRDAAGPRFESLELHVRVHLAAVTDDRATMADALGPAFGLTPEQALRSPHALAGTVDEIADDLVERRDRWGISYIGVGLDALHELAPVVARMAGT
ncbi:MAG TPA: LLM class F420-dependent oxidoreductase [Acidimicrobiales bacterium]|nr:LLM class F420-dependent oxidoreductase [Acidimicrobiales bacterium]